MVTILKGYNQLQNVILTYNKLVKLVTVMLLARLSNDQQFLWQLSLLIPELLEFFLLKDVSALQSCVQSLVLQSCERHAVFQFKFAIV